MPQDKKGGSVPVAQVEDYDSDESRVVPETVVQASHSGRPARSQHANLNLKPTDRSSHRRDAASDSGYSSHASAPLASTSSKSPAPAPAVTTARQPQSPVKSKPILHRADSARSTQRAQTVTTSTTKCPKGDPNCRDPECFSKRNSERRHTFYQPPTTQQPPPQPQYSPAQYQSVPQYHYAQPNPGQMSAAQAMPPPARPRSGSISRPRPLSMNAGYAYDSTRPGPPPSASAYYSYYPQQAPQQYLGTTPPTQVITYPPQSPVPQSPTSPTATYPGFPGYTGTFSARQMNPSVPGLETFKPSAPGLSRTVSARRPSDRPVPGKFPDPESTESESDSSSSGSEYSESEEEDHHRRRRESYRDPRTDGRRMAIVQQSSRRPSVSKKYYTETSVPTKSRRESRPQEPLRRAPRSDTGLDYPSSSDINDSDRTQRAVVDRSHRRSTLSSAHSSRRPSVSTTASSGRTKATSLSSMTDYSRVIIESPSGRRTAYLSKEEQASLIRRLQQQKLDDKLEEQRIREEKIAAYQRDIGGESYDLTAERVKAQNRKSGSHSHSHVSRGKSSTHSGSKTSRSDGIKIKSGDTVLHVYGDAKIEMRPSEDGGAPQLVIASTSGRDSGYQGSSNSKSSGSRMGRSRVSRRDKAIREEDFHDEGGFEKGY
ncbi:hypothetical protein PRZ48_006008 [Zasmidium cellare]|uniref:Uncharacterized protein n=1 Tax=Zasmidium cellare TaxID=395010 RepID=A0ABR0EM78_ZASCE|nr:hypothetical protein PRZ48_006008 [Zasmidium cellare]